MRIISEKIKCARTSRGDSQETLAQKIGVSRQTIINWEKGKTIPDSESLIKLAKLYQLSLDDWFELNIVNDASVTKYHHASIIFLIIYIVSLLTVDVVSSFYLMISFILSTIFIGKKLLEAKY